MQTPKWTPPGHLKVAQGNNHLSPYSKDLSQNAAHAKTDKQSARSGMTPTQASRPQNNTAALTLNHSKIATNLMACDSGRASK